MSSANIKIDEGGWTPALRQMAIDIMDNLVSRPASSIISDPRNGSQNTFQGIRDKLYKKKYSLLAEWSNDMGAVFSAAKATEDPLIIDIANELQEAFNKKYALLEQFSNFKFKSAITSVLNEISEIRSHFPEDPSITTREEEIAATDQIAEKGPEPEQEVPTEIEVPEKTEAKQQELAAENTQEAPTIE